ncbi:hypothetical protein GCM10010174_18360 [Kutzneria viridogrisea]|uniref:Acyl carrier protein n=1 Tax=Kutzneria viridogrisea TaxID=47990 RepID=A0ABR6B7K6_9PSEU|nr:acyl carrier protein [Kutzneria viridogrisea]
MTPTETRHGVFTPILRGLRAEALDCIQANLAVLADQQGGSGTHLALGSALRFPVDSTMDTRLSEAAEQVGAEVVQRWDDADVRDLAEQHPVLYVVADAYELPWVPYAGQQHMEHSFLLLGPSTVADAYHNDTQWGAVRPGVWKIGDTPLPRATAFTLEVRPTKLDPAAVVAANAAAMTGAVPAIEAYVQGCNEDLPQLVLDVWVIGRSRLLHAAWLASVGLPAEAAEQQAQDWLSFAAQTYVAMRRAQRGGPLTAPIDTELHRLLHGDVALAQDLFVRSTVNEALCSVLRLDAVPADGALRDLPGYNSFKLVDVINRVEDRLGVQVDPRALTAQNLRDPASLCRLFVAGEA